MKRMICFFGLLLLMSCDRRPLSQDFEFETFERPVKMYSNADIEVPKELWEVVLDDAEDQESGEWELDFSKMKMKFFPLDVYLVEKTEGILRGKNYKVVGNEEGNIVDLAQLLNTEIRGTFYLSMEFPWEEWPEKYKVYFVPWVRSVEVEGKTFGLGCNRFLDLTSYFKSDISGPGIALNTTDLRYLFSASGVYLIIYPGEEEMHIGHVSINDSRYDKFTCAKSER
jgi:hypothetical protein